MKEHSTIFIFIILMFISLTSTCNKSLNTLPEIEKAKEQKWINLVSNGDQEFQKMYWAGWKNAIRLYERALKLKKDERIKQKLFFSLLLLAIREKKFDVRNDEYIKKAEELLSGLNPKTFNIYLDISKRIVNAPGLSEKFKIQKFSETSPEVVKKNIEFLKTNSKTDYLYYFYLLYFGQYASGQEFEKYNIESERFLSDFPYSNLKIEIGGSSYDLYKMLEKFPDFIELILLQADQLYRTGKYTEAESRYRFILEINSKVPSAFTGIGSIYFWLELYDEADYNYNQALAITPYFSKALFGKAMCKHYAGEFEISNDILSELIEKQPLYHGEAYYYMALNHYNLKNNNEVKKNIEKAISFIPNSTDLNAFAGIFYYYLKDLKKAKFHLKKVFKHGVHHADAYFYTGLIAMTEKKPAENYFTSAARYYWEDIERQQIKLNRVENLSLNEKLKIKLKAKRLKRLKNTAKDSIEKLTIIIKFFESANRSFSKISDFLIKIKNQYQYFSRPGSKQTP
jgi:Tfp pilus assembly protein PilF